MLKKNEDVLTTGMDKKNDAQFEEIFNALTEAERGAVQPVLRIVAHSTQMLAKIRRLEGELASKRQEFAKFSVKVQNDIEENRKTDRERGELQAK